MTKTGRRKVLSGKLKKRRARRKPAIRIRHNYAQYASDRRTYGQDVADYNDGFVAGWENGGANVGRHLLKVIDSIALALAKQNLKTGAKWSNRLRRSYEDAVALVEKRIKADKKIKAKHAAYDRKVGNARRRAESETK